MPFRMKYYKSLGDLFRDYRAAYSLSQEAFAEKLDVNFKTYQRWERNEHPAKEENLFKFSQVTGTPLYVTKSLNNLIPLFYSIKKRKWANSQIETKTYFFPNLLSLNSSDEEDSSIRFYPLDNIDAIKMVKESDKNIYPSQNSFDIQTAYHAFKIVPHLNFFVYDQASLLVGHQVCLPLCPKGYAKLKSGQISEREIGSENLYNVLNHKSGVLYFCAGYGASNSIQHYIVSRNVQFLFKYWSSELTIAAHVMNEEGFGVCQSLGLKPVFENHKEFQTTKCEYVPTIFEASIRTLAKSLFNLS